LHFAVIAEQVEDQASLAAAQRIGVDFVQGYAISRPEPMQSMT
jgi:EAL domain-containing protein (putative c-di-GMP-specific phosphodiesterase class I)